MIGAGSRGPGSTGAGSRRALVRGRWAIEGTFACALIDAESWSASHACLKFERSYDEYILEIAIVWRIPLLDPARWEAIVSTLGWTRRARRLRRVRWIVALALRLALVRRRTGARSLLMGICLGSLVEVVHDCEVLIGKERKM